MTLVGRPTALPSVVQAIAYAFPSSCMLILEYGSYSFLREIGMADDEHLQKAILKFVSTKGKQVQTPVKFASRYDYDPKAR